MGKIKLLLTSIYVWPVIHQVTEWAQKHKVQCVTNRCFNGTKVFSFLLEQKSQDDLVVPEELDPYPAPQVEEDVDRDGDRQQQAVETQTAAAGAALREVIIHCSRVEQTKERHYRDQSHHH